MGAFVQSLYWPISASLSTAGTLGQWPCTHPGHLLLRIDNRVMVPPDLGGYTPINPDPLMSGGRKWGNLEGGRAGGAGGAPMIYGRGKLLQPRFLLFTLQPSGRPALITSSTSSSPLKTPFHLVGHLNCFFYSNTLPLLEKF